MLCEYAALPMSLVPSGIGYCTPEQVLAARVRIDDRAIEAMTDLMRVSAVIIRPTDSIDEANERMKQRGVRLLLVVNAAREVVGLITAADIHGDRPMRFVEANGVRHQDILVRDIMTPQEQMEAIDMQQVESSRVGHVVATLRETGRQHALVVESGGAGGRRVRGIFSATQLARQLGVDVQSVHAGEIAHTCAEIGATLGR